MNNDNKKKQTEKNKKQKAVHKHDKILALKCSIRKIPELILLNFQWLDSVLNS